jgi:hypothetical protein
MRSILRGKEAGEEQVPMADEHQPMGRKQCLLADLPDEVLCSQGVLGQQVWQQRKERQDVI